MSRRSGLAILVIALLTVNLIISASSGGSSDKTVLAGNGIGSVRFGTAQAAALSGLAAVMGHPAKQTTFANNQGCGFTASSTWATKDSLTVFFDRRRFVGYSYWGKSLTTTAGLAVGTTLARVRELYGRRLRFSTVQGGAWFVKTPPGAISGFLSQVPRTTDPKVGVPPAKNRLVSIGAGNQGCPAMSP